jgi:Predicted membrane protein
MFGFFIILLCIAAYYHCKETGCHFHNSVNSHPDALEILRTRYARGEINSEEFNERKKALE